MRPEQGAFNISLGTLALKRNSELMGKDYGTGIYHGAEQDADEIHWAYHAKHLHKSVAILILQIYSQ